MSSYSKESCSFSRPLFIQKQSLYSLDGFSCYVPVLSFSCTFQSSSFLVIITPRVSEKYLHWKIQSFDDRHNDQR